MEFRYIVVASEQDPVARLVLEGWGTPASTGQHVDGAPIRVLSSGVGLLRRPGLHIHDEHLDASLPPSIVAGSPTLVFPSVHRSDSGQRCTTVHPLGNPGEESDVGGSPRTLVPTDPRLMTDCLRRLAETRPGGLPATFEATHHGPSVELPAFFAEIACDEGAAPDAVAAAGLAKILPDLARDPSDHVALGVGGGHYAPRFSDLALRRRWAFGHLLSRHVLERIDRATTIQARQKTPGAEGVLFARAADAIGDHVAEFGPRLSEGMASKRR